MYVIPSLLIVLCLRIEVSLEKNNQNRDETYFAFNFTHIVFHSILFCGPNIICNKSLLATFNLSNLPASGVNRCGSCSCHEDCFTSRSFSNCCPDIFFRQGLRECLNVNILSDVTFYTNIISSCPVDTVEYVLKECTRKRSKVDLLLNPPVTNSELSVTYMNEYCALCNKVGNVKKWNAKFRCLNDTDFNYLSTFQEIIQLAIKESCNVGYDFDEHYDCLPESDKLVSKCNVSGSWLEYDKQINQACQRSYLAPIGIFKNMYCAMCNPPEYQKSLMIEECTNVSSVYKHACLNFPLSEASRPFKNHFCFLCNFDENNQTFFTDVNFRSADERLNEEPLLKNYLFRLTIFFNYNDEDLHRYINQYIRNSSVKIPSPVQIIKEEEYDFVDKSQLFCPPEDKPFFPPSRGIDPVPLSLQEPHSFEPMEPPTEVQKTINLNKLILKSFAFSGHGVCSQELLPNYTKPLQIPCSCDIGCTSSCCDDFAFKQPWICVDNRYKRDSRAKVFMAINGCIKDSTLEPLCKGGFNEHFYQAFPVITTSGFFETYVNIFCYFCNQFVNSDNITRISNATLKVRVWPLLLDCRTYVNYRNFQSLQRLIDFASKSACIVSFSPPSNVLKCSDPCNEYRVRAIQKCNVSGTWLAYDENVHKACEHTEPFRFPMIKTGQVIYKNKFCRICNPFKSDSLGNRCDINFENTSISKACEEFPNIKACFPYKNVFCKSCSGSEMTSVCYTEINERDTGSPGDPELPGPGPSLPPPGIVNFRTLFTLNAYTNPDDIDGRKTDDECQHYQMYDDVQHTCRNLTCFPGRYLINDTCVPLLPFTSKLRYTLGLKINFSAFISINITAKDALESTKDYLSDQLACTLNTNVFIEEIIIMGTEACATAFHKLRNIYVYVRIFIDKYIQREQVENALLNFTQSSSDLLLYFPPLYFVKSSGKFADIALSHQPIFLPSLLWKFDKKRTCFVLFKDATSVHKLFRNTIVSPLLSCKQFEVHNNEFGIDWANIKEEFSFPGLTISVQPYHTSDNGGIRICVDDLLLMLQSKQKGLIKPNKTALEIITLVCIVISLVSLAVTFITYLLFPSLRTVPGLNNMCLVISLFMAQLSMVSSALFRSSGLKIVFAFTHFSWLATFFWLQICSFHMYRVFSAKSRSTLHGSQTKKIMTQYGIYAFGSAAIIVGANIITTLIVSSGKYSGYDKISTLLTYKIAFIVTVIVPLIFVCMTNILFYILTVYNIHSTPDVENKTGNRMHFSVYIKLFSITGLSWLLQIIDMFLEMSLFAYIVAVLNGLQGLFIFVSYVCNRRVLKMYAGLCCKANRQNSSKSSRTSNTANTTL